MDAIGPAIETWRHASPCCNFSGPYTYYNYEMVVEYLYMEADYSGANDICLLDREVLLLHTSIVYKLLQHNLLGISHARHVGGHDLRQTFIVFGIFSLFTTFYFQKAIKIFLFTQ